MISDRDAAQLQLAAYEYDLPFAWDWSMPIAGDGDMVLGGLKSVEGSHCVILPGTRTKREWELNFTALPSLTDHPVLGRVHEGFYRGIPAFVDAMASRISGVPLVVIGHSRGAGEAPLVAAEMILRGLQVERLVLFAPPRAGERELVDFLAPVSKALYRNAGPDGHDYVTDVPFDFPGTPFAFEHVAALTDIHAEPPPDDPWGPFRFHHMQLYASGTP